jgi:hypothetical protein
MAHLSEYRQVGFISSNTAYCKNDEGRQYTMAFHYLGTATVRPYDTPPLISHRQKELDLFPSLSFSE